MPLDTNQVTAVGTMLREMGREGLNFYNSTSYAPWNRLVAHHKALSSTKALDGLLPAHNRRTGQLDGNSIAIKPSKSSSAAAAFLSASWDFDADPWKLKYYLVLYYGAMAGGWPELGMSFRLEQPEGRGTHSYWHLQMCRAVPEDRRTQVLACHPKLPDSYPAFPLNASDATSLTASIALAMSGREGLQSLLRVLHGQGTIAAELNLRYTDAIP